MSRPVKAGSERPVREIRIRSCAGCRKRGAKDSFIRIVRRAVGGVELDPSGKMPGRGAYICPAEQCLARALKGSRLSRALRATLDPEAIDEIRAAVRELTGSGTM